VYVSSASSRPCAPLPHWRLTSGGIGFAGLGLWGEKVSFPAMLLSEEGHGPQQWAAVDIRFTHRQMSLYKAGGAIEALTGEPSLLSLNPKL
jgi:hypothetical protein